MGGTIEDSWWYFVQHVNKHVISFVCVWTDCAGMHWQM